MASLILTGALLAGCSGSDTDGEGQVSGSGTPGDSKPLPGDDSTVVAETPAEAEHIHGLAIDPGNGSLLLATHSGLWRVADGSDRAVAVGESRHDLMGFTVAGPGNYLASGHPAPDSDLPPLLGLMRSSDGGQEWRQISLLGETDFHVLAASGDRVYGIDSVSGELFRSIDSGRSWGRTELPAAPYGLAVAPGDPRRLVLATERGIFGSDDGGNTWEELSGKQTGLIVWPRIDALYLTTGDGQVMKSTDGGRSFEARGSLGDVPEAFGAGGGLLLAAIHGGEVHTSRDGGRTWQIRVSPR